jgi:tetratricopeptide (TPR) repeat protein
MSGSPITLSISETGSGNDDLFGFHLRHGEVVIASNQFLSPERSRRVRAVSTDYGTLFEHRQPPRLTEQTLAKLGSELFSIWLDPYWSRMETGSGAHDLAIASSSADVLNLPWELLRVPGGDAIGTDGNWTVRRLPDGGQLLRPAATQLPAGPLRVLYMVSSPKNEAELDYEKEEELLLGALSRAGNDVTYDSCDMGSFDELEERIAALRPHVVHLTGHGAVQDGSGYFAFEDEEGMADLRPAAQLGKMFAGRGVQCVFVSACQAGKAPDRHVQDGLAQGLLAQGVPLVIGWTASILDDVATEVGARFYREIANGRTGVDRALVAAREHAREMFAERGDPSWSLPVLYSKTRQERLFDVDRHERHQRASLRLDPLSGMSEQGFAQSFIGRRRELQALLPSLRRGDTQLLVLSGLGGAGKSTLATRLARKLEIEGWRPIALSSSDQVPLNAAELLQICGEAFSDAGLVDVQRRMQDPTLAASDRLRLLVRTLNEHKFLLILDNFESNLDAASYRILDPEIAAFYRYMLERLQGSSRVIITTRYLPSDMPLPQRAREWQLGEFSEPAFIKFLLRDPIVEQRYRTAELPHGLLQRLYAKLGGTPRFLVQIRKLLETMRAKDLEADLNAIALPGDGKSLRELQRIRDAYCESIFTARLYGALPEDAQQLLRRAAVLGIAVPIDGLAAVGGVSEASALAAAEAAGRAALMHRGEGEKPLWSVYGTLRSWLLAPERLSAEEGRAANIAAGNYLNAVDESDREGELGINFIACRQEALARYTAAEDWENARRLSGSLSHHLSLQGLYDEIVRLNQEMLSNEEHPQPLTWIGSAFLGRADYSTAREWYVRASALAQSKPDLNAESAIWHQLATIDIHEGDYSAAREKLDRSLAIKQQIGDRVGEASSWHQLATIDLQEGDYRAAREKLDRSLAIKQELVDRVGEASAWHQLATIDIREGDYAAAREKLDHSLAIRQQIGDRAGEAHSWHQLASVDIQEENYPAAREKLGRSLLIKQQIGDRAGETSSWHQLATIDFSEGDYLAAREKFGRSLLIKQQIGDRAGEANSWHQLASIDLREGDYPAAREKLGRTLMIKQQIVDRAGEAAAWFQLGVIALRMGASDLALRMVALCWIIDSAIGHGDAGTDFDALNAVAGQLELSSEQLQSQLEEVAEAYRTDQGASLLQALDEKLASLK